MEKGPLAESRDGDDVSLKTCPRRQGFRLQGQLIESRMKP
jgi:hypothetical protein